MSSMKLIEILSEKHIQEVGRDLWQQFYDDNVLKDLPAGVAMKLIGEISLELYPEDDTVEYEEEFTDEHGWGLVDFVRKVVEEALDVDALTREAQENTDEMREIENARRGEY